MSSFTTIPHQLASAVNQRPEKLLLLCYFDPDGSSTVSEMVTFIKAFSKFSYTVINIFEQSRANGALRLSSKLNIQAFDGIIIHNSLSYNVDNLISLDLSLKHKLCNFNGLKVLMKQDENYRYKELAKYIGQTGFDLIFTCLSKEDIYKIYPPDITGNPKFVKMLTGYVTPTLRNFNSNNYTRKIDIGYRGSIQPLSFGRLAYEKRKIGDDILRLCKDKNLILDISSQWEERLGAQAWLNFLSSCKSTLGVESGASVFDLYDDLEERCHRAQTKYGLYRDDNNYADLYLSELKEIECLINYNQISPRHFEAAATKTLQIMYPGFYSGIFVKNRHYIELNRDYSNIDHVISIIQNDQLRTQIVDCAHDEIINNTDYWIETFIKKIDREISRLLIKKGQYKKALLVTGRNKKNILLLCSHKPSLDPRLKWISEGVPDKYHITQVGVLPKSSSEKELVSDLNRSTVVAARVVEYHSDMLQLWSTAEKRMEGWVGLLEFMQIDRILQMNQNQLSELFCIPANTDRIYFFKQHLRRIINANATIVTQVQRMSGFNAIIATDLDTLISALVIKGIHNIPVLYDAHEYWPESDVESYEFEKQYWVNMEKRMVKYVDHCQTVTPELASIMSHQYGKPFIAIPNCEPLTSAKKTKKGTKSEYEECRFLYQGNFAPKRGIDLLIKAWDKTDSRAILLLRGPDSAYKQTLLYQAKITKLLNTRIKFLEPVSEDQLVDACLDGDVGLIPYAPAGLNNLYCSPNKMSQYMAAGLPILANNTKFVAKTITESNAGIVTNFTNQHNIINSVNWLTCNVSVRNQMGENSLLYFQRYYNWNNISQLMYCKIDNLLIDSPAKALRIYNYSDNSVKVFNVNLFDNIADYLYLLTKLTKRLLPSQVHQSISIRLLSLWARLPQSIKNEIKPRIFKIYERIR